MAVIAVQNRRGGVAVVPRRCLSCLAKGATTDNKLPREHPLKAFLVIAVDIDSTSHHIATTLTIKSNRIESTIVSFVAFFFLIIFSKRRFSSKC